MNLWGVRLWQNNARLWFRWFGLPLMRESGLIDKGLSGIPTTTSLSSIFKVLKYGSKGWAAATLSIICNQYCLLQPAQMPTFQMHRSSDCSMSTKSKLLNPKMYPSYHALICEYSSSIHKSCTFHEGSKNGGKTWHMMCFSIRAWLQMIWTHLKY